MTETIHEPVLRDEALAFLLPSGGEEGVFVDCTLGGGGHSEGLLNDSPAKRRVLALDVDETAIKLASRRLEGYGDRFCVCRRNFRELTTVLDEAGVDEVSGILADLGMSSLQLEDAERGFSFQLDGPLDMRMDRRSETTAADLVNTLTERELSRMFNKYGGETFARPIAREIVGSRNKKPILRTKQLADLIEKIKQRRASKTHPATKVFQALRIVVNQELEGLDAWIEDAMQRVRLGGRFVVISFHSLEDRLVKRAFRTMETSCICPPKLPVCRCGKEAVVKVLTRQSVTPSDAELQRNPRARSARLRAAEKI